jgi:hypothetical protein
MKSSAIKYLQVLLFPLLFLGLIACEDDFQSDISGNVLSFSKDTLTFDTVFTSIGSATSKMLVYNRLNKAVRIDEIRLSGGATSAFRINVDGVKSVNHDFQDIVIRAKDSLYIFVEVNINPNDENTPVLVQDSIMFIVDSKPQRVLLEAYGQDVEVLRGKVITTDTILSANKPYLVYDSIKVNPDVTLTLPAGAVFYFHHNASLFVYGNLRAEGTFDQPVTLRGDRLDKIMYDTPIPYKYVAGQWGGVYLLNKTGNHVLNHVDLSSGYVGLYFYNGDRNFKPSLEINNSRIHNFLLYNIVAVNGDLLVTNSEISNSGSYTVYLNGGKHAFYHCTIANFFSSSSARPVNRDNTPAVMLMDLNKALAMETIFKNCIITGTSTNELAMASKFRELYNGEFQYSYIRKPDASTLPAFSNIRWYQQNDTVFKVSKYDYKEQIYFDFTPDSVSPARGLADPAVAAQFPLDLNGRSRLADGEPDAGAYEWYPTTVQ